MRIIRDEKLIRRNARIGQVTSLVALLVLGVGMYISLRMPEQFAWALGALVLGFVLTQVSIYFGNRWGRSPRPDELLDTALKGLPGNYTLYHYASPVSHLLIGPAGVWVLLPYSQAGTVTYEKRRWRVRGGGFWQAYMRLFGQEGLGRPDLEAEAEIAQLRKRLARRVGEELPPIRAMLIFTHPQVVLQAEECPHPALPAKKVKDYLRKQAKEAPLAESWIRRLQEVLG